MNKTDFEQAGFLKITCTSCPFGLDSRDLVPRVSSSLEGWKKRDPGSERG